MCKVKEVHGLRVTSGFLIIWQYDCTDFLVGICAENIFSNLKDMAIALQQRGSRHLTNFISVYLS